MRKCLTAVAIATFCTALFAATSNSDSPAVKLISKVSKGQLMVKQQFKSVGDLQGFVVQPKKGGRKAILFADKSGQYVIAGNVLDAKGINLTEQATQKYINANVAKKAYAQAKTQYWFSQGKAKAPHKAYIIVDPNCIFCHMLFKKIEPMIEGGDLQVRWIPVGFLNPTSAGKAAQIMLTTDNKTRLKQLFADEDKFDKKTEEGALTPLKSNAKDKAVTKAFNEVKSNTDFFRKYGFQGTPTILYLNKDGQAAFYPGYLRGKALQSLVGKMSGKW